MLVLKLFRQFIDNKYIIKLYHNLLDILDLHQHLGSLSLPLPLLLLLLLVLAGPDLGLRGGRAGAGTGRKY